MRKAKWGFIGVIRVIRGQNFFALLRQFIRMIRLSFLRKVSHFGSNRYIRQIH
jgi:hypothetical protein